MCHRDSSFVRFQCPDQYRFGWGEGIGCSPVSDAATLSRKETEPKAKTQILSKKFESQVLGTIHFHLLPMLPAEIKCLN